MKDAMQMVLDRCLADSKRLGNLPVALPFGYKGQHLALALGELVHAQAHYDFYVQETGRPEGCVGAAEALMVKYRSLSGRFGYRCSTYGICSWAGIVCLWRDLS